MTYDMAYLNGHPSNRLGKPPNRLTFDFIPNLSDDFCDIFYDEFPKIILSSPISRCKYILGLGVM